MLGPRCVHRPGRDERAHLSVRWKVGRDDNNHETQLCAFHASNMGPRVSKILEKCLGHSGQSWKRLADPSGDPVRPEHRVFLEKHESMVTGDGWETGVVAHRVSQKRAPRESWKVRGV